MLARQYIYTHVSMLARQYIIINFNQDDVDCCT